MEMKIGSFQIRFKQLIFPVVILVIMALIMNFSNRLGELARVQDQVATVRAQATGVNLTQQVLEQEAAFATSPAAADNYARGEAHLAKPGDEVMVILPEPGVTPTLTPIPTEVSKQFSSWDVWMFFLFGK